jgi:hypothetical protein
VAKRTFCPLSSRFIFSGGLQTASAHRLRKSVFCLRQRIFYPLKFLVVAAAVWRQNLDQLKFSAAGDGATSFRQSITVPFSGRPFPKRGMISMTTKFVAAF